MRRHPAVLAALASALLATACGPHKDLALDLRGVAITVPRLVTPAVELVAPPVVPPPVSLPPIPTIDLPPAVASEPLPAPAPAPACPKASPFDVPAQPASQLVTAPPAPGVFVQQATGSSTAAGKSSSLAGPVTVTVTATPKSATSVGQQVDTWRVVRSDATDKYSSVEYYQLVHPSDSPLASPAGVYLVGLAWNDPVRGNVTFQPSGSGLLILPSPVEVATSGVPQYVSSATDPATLTTLTLTRNVTGRKRVDACGHLIDTFTVAMTGTLVTRDTQRQVGWTQQLATSYGAADVEDHLTLSSPAEGLSWDRLLRNTALPKETT